jgi:DNA-binding LytR/AlgR family response regulator
MKWKCLVIDDEPHAREVIKTHISNTPSLELVGETPHALAAFEFLQQNTVDLLFLDIEMPKLSGIDLVKTLSARPKIIFTTAHKDYAWDGFELGAVDFLLKPVSFERFLRAVQKMTQPIIAPPLPTETRHERFIYFRSDRKMVKVAIDEILYVESLKDYVKVVLTGKQVITKQTITTVEDMLPATEFLRVHRSFIVNQKKLDSFTSHALFIGKEEIPIGPMYRLDINRKLTFTH